MSRKKKCIIFTDVDLDGAMAYLLFSWFKGHDVQYITVRAADFHDSFYQWTQKVDPKIYDQIYILDLDVSQTSVDLVDMDNVVIIDHHLTHVHNKHKYTNAKVFVREHTSCARLIYELLHKKSKTALTDAHKHLILLVDDYDSYTLQLKYSYELNLLFWNYQGDKLKKFVTDFRDGFTGFTDDHKKIISFHKKKINKYVSQLQLYGANIPINGNYYKFVSTFADKYINDIADYILREGKAEVGMVINLESNKVSIRKQKGVNLDLSDLAKKLLDGGGHSYASGGKITEKFTTFSKLFEPIK